MGMYGNGDKDFLYEEMVKFLKEHPVSEFLEMASNAVHEATEYDEGAVMDKSVPAKTKTVVRRSKHGGIERRCPNCMQNIYHRVPACPSCGQALEKWGTGKDRLYKGMLKGR